jgi:hypothetical protein
VTRQIGVDEGIRDDLGRGRVGANGAKEIASELL